MSDKMMQLVEDMWDELDGAKHYAEQAMAHKGMNSAGASTYAEMARQELVHFDNLHKMAVQELSNHAGEEHKAAALVWSWEHEKMMRRAAKIRAMLDMAK